MHVCAVRCLWLVLGGDTVGGERGDVRNVAVAHIPILYIPTNFLIHMVLGWLKHINCVLCLLVQLPFLFNADFV